MYLYFVVFIFGSYDCVYWDSVYYLFSLVALTRAVDHHYTFVNHRPTRWLPITGSPSSYIPDCISSSSIFWDFLLFHKSIFAVKLIKFVSQVYLLTWPECTANGQSWPKIEKLFVNERNPIGNRLHHCQCEISPRRIWLGKLHFYFQWLHWK